MIHGLPSNICTILGSLGLIGTPVIAANTVPTEHNAFIGYIVLTGLNLAVSISSIATGFAMRKAANKPIELQQPVITQLKKEMASTADVDAQRRFTGHVKEGFERKLEENRNEAREERRRIFVKLDIIAERLARLEAENAALKERVGEINKRISA